jgi:hypothetical protein
VVTDPLDRIKRFWFFHDFTVWIRKESV